MNRENKRKIFEKGYYKTHPCRDSFTCKVCGWLVTPEAAGSDYRKLSSNRSAADDNPVKLMSIALKPLAMPPFPLERIEAITTLMGGEGRLL